MPHPSLLGRRPLRRGFLHPQSEARPGALSTYRTPVAGKCPGMPVEIQSRNSRGCVLISHHRAGTIRNKAWCCRKAHVATMRSYEGATLGLLLPDCSSGMAPKFAHNQVILTAPPLHSIPQSCDFSSLCSVLSVSRHPDTHRVRKTPAHRLLLGAGLLPCQPATRPYCKTANFYCIVASHATARRASVTLALEAT